MFQGVSDRLILAVIAPEGENGRVSGVPRACFFLLQGNRIQIFRQCHVLPHEANGLEPPGKQRLACFLMFEIAYLGDLSEVCLLYTSRCV